MQNRPSFFTVATYELETATSTPLNEPMLAFVTSCDAEKDVPPPVRSMDHSDLEHDPARMKYLTPL